MVEGGYPKLTIHLFERSNHVHTHTHTHTHTFFGFGIRRSRYNYGDDDTLASE